MKTKMKMSEDETDVLKCKKTSVEKRVQTRESEQKIIKFCDGQISMQGLTAKKESSISISK